MNRTPPRKSKERAPRGTTREKSQRPEGTQSAEASLSAGAAVSPHVKMPVNQVTKTTALEKNCVYLIPPNSNLEAIDTHLRLADLEARRQERAPIDHAPRCSSARRHAKD